VRAESLPFVFESFLTHLAEAEAEEWAKAGQSAATYASAREGLGAEVCPSQEQPATDVFPPYNNGLERSSATTYYSGSLDVTQAL